MESKMVTGMAPVCCVNLPRKLYRLRNFCIRDMTLSFFLIMLPATQYTQKTHYEFPTWEKEKGINKVFFDLVGIETKNQERSLRSQCGHGWWIPVVPLEQKKRFKKEFKKSFKNGGYGLTQVCGWNAQNQSVRSVKIWPIVKCV